MAPADFSPVSTDLLAFFQSIPWCAKQLTEYAPNVLRGRPQDTEVMPGVEDYLFIETLNTPDTIRSMLLFYHDIPDPHPHPDTPPPRPGTAEGPPPPPTAAPTGDDDIVVVVQKPLIAELRVLISLGHKVGGYLDIAHGGFVMAIFDEVAGYLLRLNRNRAGMKPDTSVLSSSFTMSFLKAVRIPGTFLLVARVNGRSGRKFSVVTWMEDENGVVLAKGELVFVIPREKKL